MCRVSREPPGEIGYVIDRCVVEVLCLLADTIVAGVLKTSLDTSLTWTLVT